jgi:hypothetical protein
MSHTCQIVSFQSIRIMVTAALRFTETTYSSTACLAIHQQQHQIINPNLHDFNFPKQRTRQPQMVQPYSQQSGILIPSEWEEAQPDVKMFNLHGGM